MESLVPTIGGDDSLITSAPTYFYNNYPENHSEKIETLSHPRIKTNTYNAWKDYVPLEEAKEDTSNWAPLWGAIYFRPSYWNFKDSNEMEATSECIIGFKNVNLQSANQFTDRYDGKQSADGNDRYTGLSFGVAGNGVYLDNQGLRSTVLTMKSDGDVCVGGGWTCLEAECWSNCANIPAPIASGSSNISKVMQNKLRHPICLKFNMKVGKYWLHQGSFHQNLYWSTDKPSETYNIELKIGEIDDKVQRFEQWHSLMNANVRGIDSVGYKVQSDSIIIGQMEINFCLPYMDEMDTNEGKKYKQYHWLFMKNFVVKNAMVKEFADNSGVYIGEEDNNDIIWSTVISQDYSIEGESINLKLNTPSSNEFCYSDVFHSTNGETFTRLETVDKGEGEYPAEQYKLNSYYWQNRVPRKILDVVTNIIGNPIAKYKTPYSEMAFICNSLSIDYAEAKSTLQLIEKESL
jgi:hypothetical protein